MVTYLLLNPRMFGYVSPCLTCPGQAEKLVGHCTPECRENPRAANPHELEPGAEQVGAPPNGVE